RRGGVPRKQPGSRAMRTPGQISSRTISPVDVCAEVVTAGLQAKEIAQLYEYRIIGSLEIAEPVGGAVRDLGAQEQQIARCPLEEVLVVSLTTCDESGTCHNFRAATM